MGVIVERREVCAVARGSASSSTWWRLPAGATPRAELDPRQTRAGEASEGALGDGEARVGRAQRLLLPRARRRLLVPAHHGVRPAVVEKVLHVGARGARGGGAGVGIVALRLPPSAQVRAHRPAAQRRRRLCLLALRRPAPLHPPHFARAVAVVRLPARAPGVPALAPVRRAPLGR
eukprot:3195362-Rhodomonas_salina.2